MQVVAVFVFRDAGTVPPVTPRPLRVRGARAPGEAAAPRARGTARAGAHRWSTTSCSCLCSVSWLGCTAPKSPW